MELLKKYEEIEMYDTEDVTEDIIEAFKDLKCVISQWESIRICVWHF